MRRTWKAELMQRVSKSRSWLGGVRMEDVVWEVRIGWNKTELHVTMLEVGIGERVHGLPKSPGRYGCQGCRRVLRALGH